MQKGQTPRSEYAVCSGHAVGVGAKKSTHTVDLAKYGWWGQLPLVQKGQTHAVGTQCTVGTQYALGVSAKRSTGTVDLANMGGGDRYL